MCFPWRKPMNTSLVWFDILCGSICFVLFFSIFYYFPFPYYTEMNWPIWHIGCFLLYLYLEHICEMSKSYLTVVLWMQVVDTEGGFRPILLDSFVKSVQNLGNYNQIITWIPPCFPYGTSYTHSMKMSNLSYSFCFYRCLFKSSSLFL